MTTDRIKDWLSDANDAAHEYYRDGDGTDVYSGCFTEDIGTAQTCNERAGVWLRTAGNDNGRASWSDPHVDGAAIAVYQRWLENREPDEIAEPEFSGTEYWQSPHAITGYGLPEYETIGVELNATKHKRIIAAINDAHNDAATEHDNGGDVLLFLSGQIEYITTQQHRRAARLILHLFDK